MTDWRDAAACRGVDPALFSAERGDASDRLAKAVCATCTVQSECLVYALEHGERLGVWGGLSEKQRRRLRALLSADGGTSECEACEAVVLGQRRRFCDACLRDRHIEQSRRWRQTNERSSA